MINENRLIQTFLNMVQIDSESGQEKAFAEYMVDLFKNLGYKVRMDKWWNVYVTIPGKGKPLMWNTHMDTVVPGKNIKPIVKDGSIFTDGTTVLGADSKAGIAGFVEAVRVLKEKNLSHRPIQIVLSGREEVGVPTANYIHSKVTQCIEPDRGTPIGEIITEAPFAQVFQINVKGIAAYATTSYTEGKHAIMAANYILSHVSFGNRDNYTTANIGIIQGGLMTSMVPENCTVKGNCYSFRKSSFNKFFKELQRVIQQADNIYGTTTNIEMLEYFGGFSLKKSDPLVRLADKAIRASGLVPDYKVYKAVTNANILNNLGIQTVLISTGVENQHTVNERISVDSLVSLTKILLHTVI